MLIRNYGLFWELNNVFWGRPGVRGHLQGVPKKRSAYPVDFRNQQGVYILYDSSSRMVYVGQSGANAEQRLFDRLKQHTVDHLADRWTIFSWFGVRSVNFSGKLRVEWAAARTDISDVLNHTEAILIYASAPSLNKQGGPFGRNVEQYFQHRDDRLGPE